MISSDALRTAIDLVLLPSGVRFVKRRPLPPGVSFLLSIVAGDEDALKKAIELTERPEATIRAAAGFFVEQVLLDPDCDSYRVLGGTETSSGAELRQNMALLLRWLHPDLRDNRERAIYAARITTAWNNIKTPERRAAYDRYRAEEKKASNGATSSEPAYNDRRPHFRPAPPPGQADRRRHEPGGSRFFSFLGLRRGEH